MKDLNMTLKHSKICSVLQLVEIKTAWHTIYHLREWQKNLKSMRTHSVRKAVGNKHSHNCLWECKSIQPSWQISDKYIFLPFNWWFHFEEFATKIPFKKYIWTRFFITTWFVIAESWEKSKCCRIAWTLTHPCNGAPCSCEKGKALGTRLQIP